MSNFVSIEDINILFRTLTPEETARANALIPIISDTLRLEAKKVNKDLDLLISESTSYANVVKMVIVDIIARTLMTSTTSEPMSQYSESALGYSISGTFLNPGGGLFIKDTELKRLGFKKQRYGVIDLYDTSQGDNSIFSDLYE